MMKQTAGPLRLAVLISGNGSNLQALIDAIVAQQLAAQINLVISNRPDAFGLVRAKQHGIATAILENTAFQQREQYDQALQTLIENAQVDLVVLAGFMRILTPDFVHHYAGRLLNIHPALLPKYRGLHTHQQALAAGDSVHGATVHFVNEELDGGPIIAQARLQILPTDTAESLQQRVLQLEHQLYPRVVQWYATGQLQLQGRNVLLNNQILPAQGVQVAL